MVSRQMTLQGRSNVTIRKLLLFQSSVDTRTICDWEIFAISGDDGVSSASRYLLSDSAKADHDLINVKWHDCEANVSRLVLEHQWNTQVMKQLQPCNSLDFVCGKPKQVPVELAMMVGFALARSLPVIWTGSPLRILNDFGTTNRNCEEHTTLGWS